MRRSLIHLYIGEGKGKTTAAVGLSLRALIQGKKVLFIQFLKANNSSELKALKKLKAETISFKERHPLFYKSASIKKLRLKVAQDFQMARALVEDKRYNFVVLDEALYLLKYKLIKERQVLDLIDSKPKNTELILTGAYSTKALVKKADYVSTIKCTKHPYTRGIPARRGVEY
ncbi:cob(I)yrinic acid a,c-diamide adenosyltransferase [Candidatus Omnitrophota bacterium]